MLMPHKHNIKWKSSLSCCFTNSTKLQGAQTVGLVKVARSFSNFPGRRFVVSTRETSSHRQSVSGNSNCRSCYNTLPLDKANANHSTSDLKWAVKTIQSNPPIKAGPATQAGAAECWPDGHWAPYLDAGPAKVEGMASSTPSRIYLYENGMSMVWQPNSSQCTSKQL